MVEISMICCLRAAFPSFIGLTFQEGQNVGKVRLEAIV
jgi:hypothetical protein